MKKKLTPAEQKEKEKKENRKYMKDVLKKLDERRRLFVMDIVEGRIAPIKDEEKVKDALWSALVLNQSCLYRHGLATSLPGNRFMNAQRRKERKYPKKRLN